VFEIPVSLGTAWVHILKKKFANKEMKQKHCKKKRKEVTSVTPQTAVVVVVAVAVVAVAAVVVVVVTAAASAVGFTNRCQSSGSLIVGG
jgi:hypothetical protein